MARTAPAAHRTEPSVPAVPTSPGSPGSRGRPRRSPTRAPDSNKKTPLGHQQPAARLHARATEPASNTRKSQRPTCSGGHFTGIRTYRRGSGGVCRRCCASHPPPASSGCCCSSFAVRAARERPERAHKWGKGVPFHRSPSVIGCLVAPWG